MHLTVGQYLDFILVLFVFVFFFIFHLNFHFLSKFIYVLFCLCLCFVFIFHLNFHFLSKFIYVLFSFHSKICICVLFGKSLEVSPRGSSLTFPPHILYSLSVHNVGGSGEVGAPGWLSNDCQATQNQFSGAFQNSIQQFCFYFLPPIFLFIHFKYKIQAPSN